MTAPVRSKPPVFDNEFTVNESQQVLDEAYERVLGEGGNKLLTEEVKWLAVTHKSFDHGRRGYNDRLAFLGTLAAPMFQRRAVVDTF
jgi:large subunit ribosomal protein L15